MGWKDKRPNWRDPACDWLCGRAAPLMDLKHFMNGQEDKMIKYECHFETAFSLTENFSLSLPVVRQQVMVLI